MKTSLQSQVTDVNNCRNMIDDLRQHLNQHNVGQSVINDRLLMGLISNNHLLLEGASELAKTRAAKILTKAIDCDSQAQ